MGKDGVDERVKVFGEGIFMRSSARRKSRAVTCSSGPLSFHTLSAEGARWILWDRIEFQMELDLRRRKDERRAFAAPWMVR